MKLSMEWHNVALTGDADDAGDAGDADVVNQNSETLVLIKKNVISNGRIKEDVGGGKEGEEQHFD